MARLRLEKWRDDVGLRLPKHALDSMELEAVLNEIP